MNSFDRQLRRKAVLDRPEMPEDLKNDIQRMLSVLPERHRRVSRRIALPIRIGLQAAAALLVVFLVLPNVSYEAAKALGELPLIGDIVRVITIRDYAYSDGYHELEAQIPSIDMEGETAQTINEDVDRLTSKIIDRFMSDAESIGNNGHTALNIDYSVVTDTSDWFTLKLRVFQGSGSGTVNYKFYHIDKSSGQIVSLKDLFSKEGWDTAISQNITQQMVHQMEEDEQVYYWVESKYEDWNFSSIDGDQNFYFNDQGELVIVFDEYEVAPGYMGTPEFVIPLDIYEDYMAD